MATIIVAYRYVDTDIASNISKVECCMKYEISNFEKEMDPEEFFNGNGENPNNSINNSQNISKSINISNINDSNVANERNFNLDLNEGGGNGSNMDPMNGSNIDNNMSIQYSDIPINPNNEGVPEQIGGGTKKYLKLVTDNKVPEEENKDATNDENEGNNSYFKSQILSFREDGNINQEIKESKTYRNKSLDYDKRNIRMNSRNISVNDIKKISNIIEEIEDNFNNIVVEDSRNLSQGENSDVEKEYESKKKIIPPTRIVSNNNVFDNLNNDITNRRKTNQRKKALNPNIKLKLQKQRIVLTSLGIKREFR